MPLADDTETATFDTTHLRLGYGEVMGNCYHTAESLISNILDKIEAEKAGYIFMEAVLLDDAVSKAITALADKLYLAEENAAITERVDGMGLQNEGEKYDMFWKLKNKKVNRRFQLYGI